MLAGAPSARRPGTERGAGAQSGGGSAGTWMGRARPAAPGARAGGAGDAGAAGPGARGCRAVYIGLLGLNLSGVAPSFASPEGPAAQTGLARPLFSVEGEKQSRRGHGGDARPRRRGFPPP